MVTDKGEYAAGAGDQRRRQQRAAPSPRLVGLDVPVEPDNHEGAITEPVQRFFGPMVVDIRPEPGSANYYFYQNHEGQVVFCITPDPPILGVHHESTSVFFPHGGPAHGPASTRAWPRCACAAPGAASTP